MHRPYIHTNQLTQKQWEGEHNVFSESTVSKRESSWFLMPSQPFQLYHVRAKQNSSKHKLKSISQFQTFRGLCLEKFEETKQNELERQTLVG